MPRIGTFLVPLKWPWTQEDGKGLEGKKAETGSSIFKVQPQDLAHSVLSSSEMGCSAREEGYRFVRRALKYLGEKPHCITSSQ